MFVPLFGLVFWMFIRKAVFHSCMFAPSIPGVNIFSPGNKFMSIFAHRRNLVVKKSE